MRPRQRTHPAAHTEFSRPNLPKDLGCQKGIHNHRAGVIRPPFIGLHHTWWSAPKQSRRRFAAGKSNAPRVPTRHRASSDRLVAESDRVVRRRPGGSVPDGPRTDGHGTRVSQLRHMHVQATSSHNHALASNGFGGDLKRWPGLVQLRNFKHHFSSSSAVKNAENSDCEKIQAPRLQSRDPQKAADSAGKVQIQLERCRFRFRLPPPFLWKPHP